MKRITVLIPAYNEEEVLDPLYARLDALANENKKYEWEFLFVNDGSRDKTLEMIKSYAEKDSRVSFVNLARNFGKEKGMIAGFDHATGDALVVVDADLQDPPELIPEMITYWEQGFDDVYARRRSRAGETWFKKKTSKWFYDVLQHSTNVPIQRDSGDFRLINRRCIDALRSLRESERNAKGMFSWIGYKKKEILYDRDPRLAGVTKWNYSKLINLAVDGITSFTIAPLRFSTIMGMLVSFVAFLYIVWIIIKTLLWGNDLAGYPSMMAVILFLGGIQLLSLGIIGEYIGRIFNETKGRPLYLVDEYHCGPKDKK